MVDPADVSILGVDGWLVLWGVTAIAVTLFAIRVWRLVGVLRSGVPESRSDRPGKRLRAVAVNVLGQRRLLNDRGIGVAHFFIFWTFMFYASSFVWNLAVGLFRLPIPYVDEIGVVVLPMEVLTVAGLVSLGGAAVRRYVFTPERLKRSWDATLILVLITVLLVTFLVAQGAREVAHEPWAWSPVGGVMASLLTALGLGAATAETLYLWMWWTHMAVVLGFMAYLPYSKHLHLLAAPFSVYASALEPGALPSGSVGAAALDEFTWRELYSGIACAECGRCDLVCPAFLSGRPLSPKDLVHEVHESVLTAASGKSNGTTVLDRVTPEAVWACTTCGACVERCPVFNEHMRLVVQMRRHLVNEGEISSGPQETLMNMARYGNSFGKSPRARARWTRGLDFDMPDARRQDVEYLWFLGDYASFDPRLQASTAATARVFREAGLDVGILYDAEKGSGNDVRRMGEEGLFEMLRDSNLEALDGVGVRTIVTTDPHSYYALKHEYGIEGHRVLHYTELLAELFEAGTLWTAEKPMRVTYHDPCYLGRYDGVYEAPRSVIAALGHELVEMPRNRNLALCCGAGGGQIWMEDPAGGGERPAESRVREAAALDGVDTLVTACPKDYVMFQDALKTTGLDDRLVIRDVIELVEEAMETMSRSVRV